MQGGVTYNGSTLLSGSIDVNANGNIEPLTLTYNENGNYVVNAPEGVDGYDPVTINVNVPQVEPILDTLIVSQNGQYRPPEGVAGYNLVDVNVIIPPPVMDTLNVNSNGTYTPPEGVAGYNQVNVNVPVPVLNTLNVNSNGTYTPPSGVDGYDEVVVNVPGSSIDFLIQNQLIIQGNPGAYKTVNYAHSINVGDYCIIAVKDYNVVYIAAFKYTTVQQTVDIPLNNDTLRVLIFGDRITAASVGGQWRDININMAIVPSDIINFS